jgi:hypothetical protein
MFGPSVPSSVEIGGCSLDLAVSASTETGCDIRSAMASAKQTRVTNNDDEAIAETAAKSCREQYIFGLP